MKVSLSVNASGLTALAIVILLSILAPDAAVKLGRREHIRQAARRSRPEHSRPPGPRPAHAHARPGKHTPSPAGFRLFDKEALDAQVFRNASEAMKRSKVER